MARHATYQEINDHQASYIQRNHLEKTVCEMAQSLHVPVRKIYTYMGERGLSTLDKTKKKKNYVPDGMFNVNDRSDWMIGG